MKHFAVLAALLAFLLVLTGRNGGTSSAQAAVEKAVKRAADARSSRFTLSWAGPQLATDSPVNREIEGLMDYRRQRGWISYGAEARILYVGDVMYMKWPMPWRQASPWLRYDQGLDDAQLSLYDRAMRNPMDLLQFLTGASRGVYKAGTEYVRDTPTDHYEGILDLQRVVDQAAARDRADLQALLDLIREDEPTTVPFGLWVDEHGVTRRLRIDQPGGLSVTVEYYDFGVPVNVSVPPSSQIMSHEDFVQEIAAHTEESNCGRSDFATNDTKRADEFSLDAGALDSDTSSDGADKETAKVERHGIYLCFKSVSLGDE